MKTRLVRCLAMALVLTVPVLVEAQSRRRRPPDPPSDVNSCAVSGIDCLFGDTSGCSVTCREGETPWCKGARCIFGFPVAPVCTCI